MRGFLIKLLAVTYFAAAITVMEGPAAHADTVCQQTDPATGICLISVDAPVVDHGDDGPKDTGSGYACYWDGTGQGITDPPPGPVPCQTDFGYWSNGYHCYIKVLQPQPAAGDPIWQGHEPGDGAIYHCYQPQVDLLIYLWAQDPPPNSGAGPTPDEVAHLAIKNMHLSAINIGITPEPGPASVGLVGMPVWLWAANPGDRNYGPATATASAGGITITATARVHKITWVMGDGNEVVCHTAGTPYKPSFGKQKSPDCGHVYTKSSSHEKVGRFTVTAISDWVVTWAGAGQTGTIRLNGLRRSVDVAIGEAQVLVN